jgi:predicted nucleotidyltransferase component of viral defense system
MNFLDKSQLEKAKMEDSLVEILYRKYNALVFHGGTAIWRCYSGNRFSRDIDFYYGVESNEAKTLFFKSSKKYLKDLGYSLKESGYSNSTNTMHILLEANVKMKIDINFGQKAGVPVEYRKVDDTKIVVLALTPSQLLMEKIEAYEDKTRSVREYSQPEVQDLYDIYHLTSLVGRKDQVDLKRLKNLIKFIQANPPPNIRSLDHLILKGISPSFEMIMSHLIRWIENDR